MKQNIKVSVILPSYNHAEFIKQTIDSVLQQTYTNFEIIIVDDCSTDHSCQEINTIEDERIIKIFLDENIGTVRAINLGLSKASGKYIAIIGSDDIWEKNKLEKQVEILENDKEIGACFSWANIINENNQLLQNCDTIDCNVFVKENRTQSKWLQYFSEHGNCLCHSSSVVRKDVYDDLGDYNVIYRQLHDFEYWVRIINKHKIFIVQEPLVKYRRVQKNNSVSAQTTENTIRVFNEYYNIWLDYFSSYINKKIFIETFKDKLIKKEDLSSEEVICEMFFILKSFNFAEAPCNCLALRFLAERLNNNILDCLQNEYNFDLNRFYTETGKQLLFYPEALRNKDLLEEINNLRFQYNDLSQKHNDLSQKHNDLSQRNKDLTRQYEQCQNTINEILSSTSWKITRPLRKISKIFHH